MITSAGCNALDYALDGPRRIHCVDANPRQTALLELKIAGIKRLPWEDFWGLFGAGSHPDMPRLYRRYLRRELSPTAQQMWDSRLSWWNGRGWRNSFYYYGLAGLFARLFNGFVRSRPTLHRALIDLFGATSLEQQRAIYVDRVRDAMFPRSMRWVLNRQATMHLLGVPVEQAEAIGDPNQQHGIAGFIQDCIAHVCQQLPIADNYFYRVYVMGSYSPTCCPEYLKPANFTRLKAGLVDCITPATTTITTYLQERSPQPSHLVLLDHMDWMGAAYPDLLAEEWQWIFRQARPDARILFRSGARYPSFLQMPVNNQGLVAPLNKQLQFQHDLAQRLHPLDRVHTYASFFIGDRQPSGTVA